MKNLLSKILFIAIFLNIISCATYESSPSIWFFNMSDDYIYEVGGKWNGQRILGQHHMNPGDIPSENLIVKHPSDFFGPVHIEFTNAKGKLITNDFTFTKDKLPDTRHHNFDHVYIFLTQEGMEIYPRGQKEDKSDIVHENWQQVLKLTREYDAVCTEEPITKLSQVHGHNDCKKYMPIYQPSNMAKLNQYRKLYDAYEKQRLENVRKYREKKDQQNNM